MATTIRLLGPPALLRDGVTVPDPLGSEGWALLAYLLLSEHPATREELARLELEVGPRRAGPRPRGRRDDRGRSGAAAAGARRHDRRRRGRNPAGRRLAEARPSRRGCGSCAGGSRATPRPSCTRPRWPSSRPAVPLEPRSTPRGSWRSDPFDEAHHELLVRSLVAAGDRAGALAQVTACRRLFREQLGAEPSPAVRNAAGPDAPVEPMTGGGAAGRGQLEAGEAAMAAGALEYGLSCLRRACTEAAICGDGALGARSLTALGTALVHAVRGRDEEGAAVLHQAARGGRERGRSRIAGRRAARARLHRHPGGAPRGSSSRGWRAPRSSPRATPSTRRS